MNKNIVFVGFMGTGKTTIGRRVASRLGLDFYDTDEYIKKCENMSVSEIMEKKGMRYFEGAQRFAVTNICENENVLIATGGSTLADEKNREILKKNSIFVWLRASADTVYKNTKNSHNKRFELAGKSVSDIAEILKEREKDYVDSDIVIDVDGEHEIDVIVDTVVSEIKKFISAE